MLLQFWKICYHSQHQNLSFLASFPTHLKLTLLNLYFPVPRTFVVIIVVELMKRSAWTILYFSRKKSNIGESSVVVSVVVVVVTEFIKTTATQNWLPNYFLTASWHEHHKIERVAQVNFLWPFWWCSFFQNECSILKKRWAKKLVFVLL